MTPFLLLILGLLLILMEFYLPGAVMGITGGILIAVSIYLFAMQANSLVAVFFYLILVAVLLVLLIKFAIWRIRTAKPERVYTLIKPKKDLSLQNLIRPLLEKKGPSCPISNLAAISS